ncbi:hypothetical protein MesoLjLc_05250 [Mesorhizobium sp. L-8-10]|nr:hypothetical protein MesoLjLc_05250 [Mesorhizobium sp. L-8-10]
MTILAAGAALIFVSAASAQEQPAAPPAGSAPTAPSAQPARPSIQSVNIVDIKELPEATQTQVNEVVDKTSDADLQKLRSTVDATPQVKSALEAKGLSSAQVVAFSMGNDGVLTLITKKPG